MSYIYSRALVEAFLLGNCSDTDASALLSEMLMLKPCLWHDRMTEPFPLSRFGMTCRPSTDDLGAALLMSSLEDSRVRILARQEKAQVSPEPNQACGSTWRESSVKYDLDSCSWRTVPCSSNEVLPWSSVTLPKWGMTLNGVVFQHPTSVRPINVTGSGLWLTPQANEDACGTPNGKMQKMLGNDPKIRGTTPEEWARGTLNPNWVEWLMGWPIAHTDLEPLETGKYLKWQQQHSKY